ncbi:hypothetical protein J6590_060558 [Homalodisca vitripennis]|nr:hypothetical protein J6590_060558 [Homalodisca vitripennis]
MNKTDFVKLKFQYWIARTIQSTARVCFGSAQLETVPCWRPATITPHQQGGALITEQTVTIWVSVNLSSPLSLRKNLVVLALYQYSRPSPLSEADNIANPRGGVAANDTMLLPNLWSSNMDETVWEDPFQFKPERHLEEDGSLKKKDLSIQFGLGKHLCSGETFARQNMFLVFAAMMQNFSLELPSGQPLPNVEMHVPGINVSPQFFSVKMVPR